MLSFEGSMGKRFRPFAARCVRGFVLLALLLALAAPGWALRGGVPYQEASWDGSKVVYTPKTADAYTVVTDQTTSWTNGGWYVVKEDVTIANPITVSGTANLILCDGATLNANAGIIVESGNTLNIYGQEKGTGQLEATGYDYAENIGDDPDDSETLLIYGSAGIGGGEGGYYYDNDTGEPKFSGGHAGGTVVIHGGVVTATGSRGSAGIGGGGCYFYGEDTQIPGGEGGTVTIYGGRVTANGSCGRADEFSHGGAGIGGSDGASDGDRVTIYGGTVTANGAGGGAGIGAGSGGRYGEAETIVHMVGTVIIHGGTVTANGGRGGGAGIGGGGASICGGGDGGKVNIHGGRVTANGGEGGGAGIGGGGGGDIVDGGEGGTVEITGGVITANGGEGGGAGIGGGGGSDFRPSGAGGTVEITGGAVTAISNGGGMGIGRGSKGESDGTLTLGQDLTLYGGNDDGPAQIIQQADNDYERKQYMTSVIPVAASLTCLEGSWNVSGSQVTFTSRTVDAWDVADVSTAWFSIDDTPGWYFVSGDVEISSRITVHGTVNLILCDGATLRANAGITVKGNNTLNIYAQEKGTGRLTANGGTNAAGIGGGDGGAGGTVVIHGGTVTANGGAGAAGIGGGYNGAGGTVTLYGGTVTANGSNAGIGGGYNGAGGTVTLYGGTVTATSGAGAGIGGGYGASDNGTLSTGAGIAVYGGSSENAMNFIAGENSNVDKTNRPRHMAAFGPDSGLDLVPYQELSWNGSEVTYTTRNAVAAQVKGVTTAWTTGWYYVKGNVEISSRVTVNGTVHLILCDKATLTATQGITTTNATLNIYAQSEGTNMGRLAASGAANGAGIGGIFTTQGEDDQKNGGTVTIHGGRVTATGGDNEGIGGAGIGGGSCDQGESGGGAGGTVTIYGGTIEATGQSGGAGIGGGQSSYDGGTVEIYGGEVTATGSNGGAGIGGGYGGDGGTVEIYGGTVTATSDSGAGIGGCSYGKGDTVTIYGGTVTATSGSGAGIGGGTDGDGGEVTIHSGTVTATSDSGAGIGGGSYGKGDTVTIYGGTVTATSGSGAGIGGGEGASDNGALTLGKGVRLYGGSNANPSGLLDPDNTGEISKRERYMKAVSFVPVTLVTLEPGNLELTIGETETGNLNVTLISPDTATSKDVIWSSDKPAVATVDSNGLVTGVTGGRAIVTVTATNGLEAPFYHVSASCDVTVNKGTPKVTGLKASAITYGEKLSVSNLTEGKAATATNPNVTGSFAWQSPNSIPSAGTSPLMAIFTPEDPSKYNEVSVDVSVKVEKAPLTVTAKPGTITYGDAPANGGVNYSGFVNNETSSVLDGTLSYAYSYSQYGNVGSYPITPSGLTSGNYEITFATGTLTVQQKVVGLTWGDTTFTYNGQEQAPTATATGLVNGDPVSVTVSGKKTDAGTGYTAKASGLTGTKAKNYKLPSANTKTFSIGKADPTVTAPTAGAITYGQTLASSSLTGGTAKLGEMEVEGKFEWTDPTTAPTVADSGRTPFSVTFTPKDTKNLNETTTPVTLTVTWAEDARETGTASEPVEKVTPDGSSTETQTVFTEPWEGGAIIASVDIAITTASAELTGTVDASFDTTVGVSVDIKTAYKHDSYTLSLDMTGLPEWLSVSGDKMFENVPLASKDFTLTLSGKPTAAADAKAVTIAATVTVSGDRPVLIASADKTVAVTVNKGAPDYTIPSGLTAIYGQILKDVTLPGGWAWNDSSASVGNVGSHAFPATFTPGDTSNYNTVMENVPVTVNKAASAVVTAPAPRTGLTYNTRAQELIEAGTASGGTMVYALNGGDFSAAIPTATEVGSYTVTYKIVGDANHSDTAPETLPAITITPKTEEQKAVEEKAQEIINNLDETVAKSEAGQTMTDALQSGNPETQEAAVKVVENLNKALPPETITDLTAHDVEKAVENKKEETAAAKQEEENGGVVENTTVPAGTDLLAKSDNEVLNNASENLSVSPKVVTPVAASPEETQKTADKLATLTSNDVPSGVDIGTVWAASVNMNSSNDITIQPAPSNTDEQAKHLETLLVKVIEVLAKQGEVVASALPEITSWKSGFFQFDVNLRNLLPGQRPHFWPSSEHYKAAQGKATVAGVELAAGKEGDHFFLDEAGNPTDVVSGDAAKMKVVVYLEEGKTYPDAFVTVDATSDDQKALNDLSTELTGSGAPTSDKDGGGCDAGLGLAWMLAVVVPLLRKTRK